jgi:hypothetical protein
MMSGRAASPGGPRKPARSTHDTVDVSVFAPPTAARGATIMIQVMLHVVGGLGEATQRASLFDETAALRGTSSLELDIPRGSKLRVMVMCDGLKIDAPIRDAVWRGNLADVSFLATLPARTDVPALFPKVLVCLDGAVIGEVLFKISVGDADQTARSELQSGTPKRYERVFFSYSAKDRSKVLEVAQSYRAAGVDFFQDILNFEPGARWEKGLFKEIDRCDLFLLFWSRSSQNSEWVDKEARYALERQRARQTLDIVPLVLEGPPAPTPPSHLAHLHFDDWMRFGIAALNAKKRRRWWPFS